MKLICINNKEVERFITIGKIYTSIISQNGFLIQDNNGNKVWLNEYRFKTLREYNLEKLEVYESR